MGIIETKHDFIGKCSKEEFEEIKEALLKSLDNDKRKIEKDTGPIRYLSNK